MQFIDLQSQYQLIKQEIQERFETILESASYIMGGEVAELEDALARYTGAAHCIACSSGTDALLMPLMAWETGPGDAVFVPDFSFFATAEVVALTGASPVFVDVCPDTFNIDGASLEAALTAVKREGRLRPKAVIPVDLFGLPADYDQVEYIAARHDLLLLEDGAQGFGGQSGSRRSCRFGHAAATSFFPAKPLGCYGDGGAVFTSDDRLAKALRSIRVHGQGADRYENTRLGLNGRLDTLQAAVLLAKLKLFDGELERREQIAAMYTQELSGLLQTPAVPDGLRSAWAQYTLRADDAQQRQAIMEHLAKHDIPSMIYYPIPLHRQKAFSAYRSDYVSLDVSNQLSQVVFSIPMHPYLTDSDVLMITGLIKEVLL